MSIKIPVFPSGSLRRLPVHQEPSRMHSSNCQDCEFHKSATTVCIRPEGTPGGLLVISDYPGQVEDQYGRPMVGPAGQWMRGILSKHWQGPWAITNALSCIPDGDVKEDHVSACRKHVIKTLEDVQPTLILLMGPWAGLSIFGEKYKPLSSREGYGWWCNPATGKMVPVVMLPNPAAAVRNTIIMRAFEQDFLKAIKRFQSGGFVPPDQSLYVELVDHTNVQQAVDHFYDVADYVGFDTETSGQMYTDNFRIESIVLWGVVKGKPSRGYLWDREQIEDPLLCKELQYILAEPSIGKCGFNAKYDIQAVLNEPLLGSFRGFHSDARLKRKLLAADADGSLAACAHLVGIVGHKREAEEIVSCICAELNKLASYRENARTPGAKPKKLPVFKYITPFDVPDSTTDALTAGHEPEVFAYRYIPRDIRRRYNALDVLSTILVEEWADAAIGQGQFRPVWEEITKPATIAMVEMERRGIMVDQAKMQAFSMLLDHKIKQERAKLESFKPGLNPNSPIQIANVITELGLKVKGKTKTGKMSTNEQALEALKGKHPFIDALLEFRRLDKLKSTYADGYQLFIRNGRIHTSYLLDGTECMPAGELVLTDRGYIQVEKVKVGDQVLTHEGRPKRVTATSVHEPSPIYEVGLDNGLALRTTANHPYRVGDSWVPAAGLEIGDVVAVHSDAEQWAPIKGWPGYIVSSWGRVHSLISEADIAPQIRTSQGHLKVTFKQNGVRKRGPDFKDFQVHRLVLEAFGSKPENGQETLHANGIAWDNTISNLSCGSSKDNSADQRRHGTVMHRYQLRPEMKLTEADVAEIRSHKRPLRGGRPKITTAVSDQFLAEKYNVTREMIRDIRTGKKWQPVEPAEGKRAKFHTAQVVSIKVLPDAPTYGLTVEDDASHVTGGIVTHNTGRPSSSNPNMSVLPRPKDAEGNTEGQLLRDCFIAPPDYVLLEVDRKQIEIYMAAWLSQDPVMMGILMQPDADFHLAAAKLFSKVAWGIEPDQVTDEHRQTAKTTNFAALYELPDKLGWMLSKRLKCSTEQGNAIADALFGNFKRLRQWMGEQLAFARQHGYAETQWNGKPARRRMLWNIGDITTAGEGARENAERSSWNGPDQGTSADFTTADLLPAMRALQMAGLRAYPILTIYDSIIFEVHKDDLDETREIVGQVMTRHQLQPLKLGVDMKAGPTLGSLSKLH